LSDDASPVVRPSAEERANGGIALLVDQPASPCVKICKLDAGGRYCIGCYRTREEIASWNRYDAGEKAAVLKRLPARRDLQP